MACRASAPSCGGRHITTGITWARPWPSGSFSDIATCPTSSVISTRRRRISPSERRVMTDIAKLHDAVKRGDLERIRQLLATNNALANSRSESDPRGTYALHVAAEFGQAAAARVLLEHGADVALLDEENAAVALCWAAFFGRPEVVAVLLAAASPPNQCNKHGLTPLGCAVGGVAGKWKAFSNATSEDWRKAADIIRSNGGVE